MQYPIVTMGSAGRALKTGLHVDWRDQASGPVRINGGNHTPGVLQNRRQSPCSHGSDHGV